MTHSGAVYLRNSNVYFSISECEFEGNSCANDGGSIMVYSQNNNLVIKGSNFFNDEAKQSGGSLFVDSNHVNVSISENSFMSTVAYDGGAMAFETSNEDVTISDCNITRCTARNRGGGIERGNRKFILRDLNIADNNALSGGGILVFEENYNLLLSAVTLTGNTATG